MNKAGLFVLVVLGASAIAAASSPLSNVEAAIENLCSGLVGLLPPAGQVMGAETRARANVWATAALTGALIAVLIYAIAPSVLATIYGASNFSCTGAT